MVLTSALAVLAADGARAERVIVEQAAWNDAGTRIETRRMVVLDDGRVVVRREPGGSVGGIRMVQFAMLSPRIAPWVPALSPGGARLRWANSCVFVSLHEDGSADLNGDRESEILDAVLRHWEANTAFCSYLSFVREGPVGNEPGYDGTNVVKFVDERDGWDYESGAAGITTIFHVDRPGQPDDGEILDADIELNSVDFAMADDCITSGTGRISDARNTLTHEVGHLMGLDHTCWDKPGSGPLDGDGQPVPSCFPQSSLSQEALDATMYNFQDEKETKKSSIEPDDVDGICALYPAARDPMVCERALADDGGGCLTVAGRRGGGGGAAALLLVALVLGAVALGAGKPRR